MNQKKYNQLSKSQYESTLPKELRREIPNTLSGGSVFYTGPSVGFYTASGVLVNFQITPPQTILTVKQWKAIHELKAEYEKANAMTQKIEKLKREVNNDLEKFFEANGIDKLDLDGIDSDEYDKL